VEAAVVPRLDVLQDLQGGLLRLGVDVVLGGSGLLAALGIVEVVRDWDLTTDASAQEVEAALDALGVRFERAAAHPRLASQGCFVVDAGDHTIDVISRFAVRSAQGVVAITSASSGRWRGVPLAEPAQWARAYRLMGRDQRADVLEAWLRSRTDSSRLQP
jgi:hypothetical protein